MTYDAAIRRLEISALFDLKGKAGDFSDLLAKLGLAFPDHPNTSTRSGGRELYWIGPGHWLLRAPLQHEDGLRKALGPASLTGEANVVLISDSLAIFEIFGPDAGRILAIASPLDTHASVFADNAVTWTEAFGLKALVIRRANGFELAVDRSFGVMLADCLSRAAGE